jgi:hypothetical protein
MKTIIGSGSETINWFGESTSADDLNNALDILLGKSVIVMSENICRAIRSLEQTRLGAILSDKIQMYPRSKNTNIPPEFALDTVPNITSVPQNPLFKELDAKHTRAADFSQRESRQDFFDRTLGHLLPHIKSIEIYDRFAGQNFKREQWKSSGINWLVIEQLAKSPITCHIYTCLTEPWTASRRQRSIPDEELQACYEAESDAIFETINSKLKGIEPNPNFNLEVLLFEPPDQYENDRHDRFMKLSFNYGGSLAAEWSKGAEIYDRDPVAEGFVIHDLRKDAIQDQFLAKRASWRDDEELFERLSW